MPIKKDPRGSFLFCWFLLFGEGRIFLSCAEEEKYAAQNARDADELRHAQGTEHEAVGRESFYKEADDAVGDHIEIEYFAVVFLFVTREPQKNPKDEEISDRFVEKRGMHFDAVDDDAPRKIPQRPMDCARMTPGAVMSRKSVNGRPRFFA